MAQQHDKLKESIKLQQVARRMCLLLKERQPRKVKCIPHELHPSPPFIAKPNWTELGNSLQVAERSMLSSIPGYSTTFGDMMVNCCRSLMEKFNAKCGYTQSDELTVLLAPTRVIRNEQQPHPYNGRVQKLCSLAAAAVTAHFNYQIMELCKENCVDYTPDLMVTFDCRVGQYQTQEEALSLILWRAYDCNVNGTQGAVYHCKGIIEGAGRAVGLPGDERLRWLHEHARLPLQAHERDGTYLVKRKRVVEGTNPQTGESVSCLRSRIEQIHGNVLLLYQDDQLFPSDEAL